MERATAFAEDGFFTQTLAAAAADPSVSEEIVGCYIAIFNATGAGEWQESWTKESARKKLFEDTAGDADRSFVTTLRKDGQLAGMGIVFVDELEKAIPLRDLPPALQTQEHLDGIRRNITWLAGSARICNFREYGIRKEFRGGLTPVLRLLLDPLEEAAKIGAGFAFCWTGRKTKLFPIVCGLDVRLVYDFSDPGEHVLVGDDVPHLLRRFRLPPETVGAMLAERLKQLRIR